jgi:hypothetical protein
MEVLKGNAWLTLCSWDEVPHLSESVKQELLSTYPEYQREARSRGIPSLGSGAIYKIALEDLVVPDMEIPEHCPRAYAMDVGWQRTAACHAYLDRTSDILYIYAEYYRGEAEPVVHAAAIKARGTWIKGAIDPAARGRGQIDGRNLLDMYRDLGLDLIAADNAVETGIFEVWNRMSTGRLKIFKSCQNLQNELRLYRRDEKGRIVKSNDHLCDSLRYLVMELQTILSTKPVPKKEQSYTASYGHSSTGWMG